jgi:Cu2+-exporting ATPase
MVARGHLIETLANATDVVFDKTGTLTTGRMEVVRVACNDASLKDALRIAIAMEQGAAHPAGKAITAYAEAKLAMFGFPRQAPVATALTSIAGQGIEATIEGRVYRLGRPDFAQPISTRNAVADIPRTLDESDTTTIALCSVNADAPSAQPDLSATFYLSDPIRRDAEACVDRLKVQGLTIHLLSGDTEAVVQRVAATIGISAANVRAAQTPSDKRDYIKVLRERDAIVIAIGDGVNDAPMLAEANGSIGLADGAALTRLSADAVLATAHERLLTAFANAFDTGRSAKKRITENLFWALAYNVVAIPLAVSGVVTPLVAALGMALSSLVVVVNASRLSWSRSNSPTGRS